MYQCLVRGKDKNKEPLTLDLIIKYCGVGSISVITTLIQCGYIIDDASRILGVPKIKNVIEIIFVSCLFIAGLVELVMLIVSMKTSKTVGVLLSIRVFLMLTFYSTYGTTINALSPVSILCIVPIILIFSTSSPFLNAACLVLIVLALAGSFITDLVYTTKESLEFYYSTAPIYTYVLFGHGQVWIVVVITFLMGVYSNIKLYYRDKADRMLMEAIDTFDFSKFAGLKKKKCKFAFEYLNIKIIGGIDESFKFVPSSHKDARRAGSEYQSLPSDDDDEELAIVGATDIRKKRKHRRREFSLAESVSARSDTSESLRNKFVSRHCTTVACMIKDEEFGLEENTPKFIKFVDRVSESFKRGSHQQVSKYGEIRVIYNTPYKHCNNHAVVAVEDVCRFVAREKIAEEACFLIMDNTLGFGTLTFDRSASCVVRGQNERKVERMKQVSHSSGLGIVIDSEIKDKIYFAVDGVVQVAKGGGGGGNGSDSGNEYYSLTSPEKGTDVSRSIASNASEEEIARNRLRHPRLMEVDDFWLMGWQRGKSDREELLKKKKEYIISKWGKKFYAHLEKECNRKDDSETAYKNEYETQI
jgi:hypothetical protein